MIDEDVQAFGMNNDVLFCLYTRLGAGDAPSFDFL